MNNVKNIIDIGKRITITVKSFRCIGVYQKHDLGFYRYYEFIDTDGNIFHWRQWNKPPLEAGIHSVTGTVTDFTHMGRIIKADLTRCKCMIAA